MVEYYTDGSCCGNPGPGRYGVVGVEIDTDKPTMAYCEFFKQTTNNRMELSAILYVMKHYGQDNPVVYTDSAYSLQTLTSWMFIWQEKGWIRSKGKKPENLDIIKEYYDLYEQGNRIQLKKVQGHATNKWNNVVDALATGRYCEADIMELAQR